MSIKLPKLLKGIATTTVKSFNIASNVVVGALSVFGTPYLKRLEKENWRAIVERKNS
jgi:hypothetical protein